MTQLFKPSPDASRTQVVTEGTMNHENLERYFVDLDHLPELFPTHRHDAGFWEGLGRAVATFGFLEEILGKAIFALTATRRYPDAEIQQAYERWLPTLERALTDSLGHLIDAYGKAVRDHPETTIENPGELLQALRNAAEWRNVLCHGSWRPPDADEKSVPLFVDRKMRLFETAIDHRFLAQVQRHVAELSCAVMKTVTQMGLQFPGSEGPGKTIWESRSK